MASVRPSAPRPFNLAFRRQWRVTERQINLNFRRDGEGRRGGGGEAGQSTQSRRIARGVREGGREENAAGAVLLECLRKGALLAAKRQLSNGWTEGISSHWPICEWIWSWGFLCPVRQTLHMENVLAWSPARVISQPSTLLLTRAELSGRQRVMFPPLSQTLSLSLRLEGS